MTRRTLDGMEIFMDLKAMLDYFFRGNWEDYRFPLFTPVHFLLMGLTLAGIWMIRNWREPLKRDPRQRLRRFLIGGLLLEQVTQYGWYALAGTFTLGDGLPLYICRTAILAILLALLTRQSWARHLAVYWGTFGGVLALVFPVVYPMHFPHVTSFTYFGGHILMVWAVAYLLAVEEIRLTRQGLIFSLLFTNAFNLFVLWLNPRIQGNYSYFEFPPMFSEQLSQLPRPVYLGAVFLIYNLLILLIHRVFRPTASPGQNPDNDRAAITAATHQNKE